jgi:hypothetical protein
MPKEQHQSEKFTGWQGRASFILISIGSAIGFGNLWRFPALVYKYGAGAFFVPYVLALFILGIPIMTMEVAIAQFHQRADLEAWATFGKRFRGIGLTATFSTFVLMSYYGILLGWVIRSFVLTFSLSQEEIENTSGAELYAYFTDYVVGEEPPPLMDARQDACLIMLDITPSPGSLDSSRQLGGSTCWERFPGSPWGCRWCFCSFSLERHCRWRDLLRVCMPISVTGTFPFC